MQSDYPVRGRLMIKVLIAFIIMCSSISLWAHKPAGFLWYNLEKNPKTENQPKGIPFNQLSFTQRDAVLHFYTLEALHKARNTHSIKDMRIFLSLQDYWLKESTRFRLLFQKTMLAYPQYDYQVTHPTSNLGIKITDEVRELQQQNLINSLAKSHGLLFFYRGKSPYDVKQAPIISDFCKHYGLSLIPISVDGMLSSELENSRVDQGQANRMGVHYFPAVLLVNPKTQQITPVTYGLTTQDVLAQRLVFAANQFKGAL
jgi:conjugal transfer pilus assembly protein TraF